MTDSDVFVSQGDVFVTHGDVFVTDSDVLVTHGQCFCDLQRCFSDSLRCFWDPRRCFCDPGCDVCVFPFSRLKPRNDYAHYTNENLDSINVDQIVCGYKWRLRRLHHCVSRRSRLSNFVAKFVEDNVVLVIWK